MSGGPSEGPPAVTIAISGPIGVGKSTIAQGLARALGLECISAGSVFREIARRRGISLVDVNRLAESDPAIDRDLDRLQAEQARAGPCVVESRLAGWMVEADLRVWLDASVEVRAARAAARDGTGVEEARRELLAREGSEWSRYRSLYGIDITDRKPFHVVIDTSRWDADAIVEALAALVRRMRPADQAR